ncbi:anti-sigma factor [Microbacterium sp. CFH 31415]|uniref:anti-sigma factor n=1 Tax=Microbacterium sp. CFH 31415 TaxID=2921732 RepID=UPI001F147296|nr:anti-sigma factor [Microbacterium sp. CFH 31415]MCH6230074.1 anti-sigma factor [Microbacterium sp. CFH 31415]
MNEQEFAELSAGYALDALSPEDRRAFQAALAEHPEWVRLVDADVETAGALAESVPDAAPPLTLRSTLLSRVATMPQLPEMDAAAAAVAEPVASAPPLPPVPPVPPLPGDASAGDAPAGDALPGDASMNDAPFVEPAPTTTTIQAISRRNWTRGLLTLAASLVILVVLGFGAVTINQYVNRPPEVAALAEIEAAPDAQAATVELTDGGTATAHWAESVGKVVLVSNGLPEISEDESFELWFVREDGTPVAAGVFEPAEGPSTVILDGEMQAGDTIAVTVEPQGGSPNGEPSGEPIVAIPTA